MADLICGNCKYKYVALAETTECPMCGFRPGEAAVDAPAAPLATPTQAFCEGCGSIPVPVPGNRCDFCPSTAAASVSIAGQHFAVDAELCLGRDVGWAPETARVLEPWDDISRVHARLLAGSPIRVQDMNSSNGTWLNGQRLSPGMHPVAVGDEVRLGESCVVRIET